MLRICRNCRIEYDGAPGSTLCPSCVKEERKSTIRDRTCRTCGIIFPGGPRAWYCPDCRAARQKEQNREYHRRTVTGTARAIGSEDICTICGTSYTVNSGRQRYCPTCASGAWKESDRRQGREYYAAHGNPDARRELRQAHTAELLCEVCRKPYKPISTAKACSPACSAELARRNSSNWERSHKDERTAYHRDLIKTKMEAMAPEELDAYRQRINATARRNYHRRKKKED